VTLARGPAWATVIVSSLVFVVLAAVLVPWDWVPGGELVPAKPLDVFTAEQIARAEEYSAVRRWLGWASYFISLVVAAVLGFTPIGARLVRRLAAGWRWWLAVPVAVLLLMAIGRLATLPFSIAIRQRSLDYGLTEQAWTAWGADYAKSLLVGWVLTSLVVLVAVGAARWSPRYWFAWGGGLAAGLVVAGSFLYPIVIEPVFNQFTSMAEGGLRTSVLKLAEEQGIEVDDVLVADASRRTTTLNAYVSGFGGTRRVVVYDNLVNEMPADQAGVVIAHELAHAKHNDVVVGTALGAVGAVIGVALLALALDSPVLRNRAGVRGAGDPATVPLLLALAALASFFVSPVQSTISRAVEVRADREALAATAEAKTFVDMQRRLTLASLSDPTPPAWSQFWFGSHPTVLQRAGLPSSMKVADKQGDS
jgi:STE24 endopeptidase